MNIKDGIYEAFVFGTNEHVNLPKSDYIKLIHALEHFIFFYYDNAEKLIKKAEKDALTIPGLKVDITEPVTPSPALTKANRYYLNLTKKDEYLTNREYEVIYLLNQGYLRKEIAENLCLKPRTIDALISNAIERNVAYNIRNLLNKIKNSDIRFCLDLTIK
ncbi:MAG: LuxR C-terminal-related transcriptional regulator [Gammaproteobacteria bacterium]|nr:LuxR C-terminal-related transcriptional regulator [Gammaproteobacteria bacterium]